MRAIQSLALRTRTILIYIARKSHSNSNAVDLNDAREHRYKLPHLNLNRVSGRKEASESLKTIKGVGPPTAPSAPATGGAVAATIRANVSGARIISSLLLRVLARILDVDTIRANVSGARIIYKPCFLN